MESNLYVEDEETTFNHGDNIDKNNEDEKEGENGKKDDSPLDKKRDRDDEEGNSPIKKKVRKSPSKKRGRKRKIEKKIVNIRIINDTNNNKKDKKEKECIDCKGVGEKECTMCGESNHICKGMIVGQDEIWICKECTEDMKDEKVMEEIKEVLKREKERKRKGAESDMNEKIYYCGICNEKIIGSQSCVKCTKCHEWIHMKCSEFENVKEARAKKDIHVCEKCVIIATTQRRKENDKENDTNTDKLNDEDKVKRKSGKIIPIEKGTKLDECDRESIKDCGWITDNIIKYAFEEIQVKYSKIINNKNIMFVEPTIAQLIKSTTDEETKEETIVGTGIRKADWVFFPLNNNDKDEVGGTHWSLLVHNKKINTFYHYDPMEGMNYKSVDEIIRKYSKGENRKTTIYHMACTSQTNGFDCGIYALMFSERILKNMEEDKEPTNVGKYMCDARNYRKMLRKNIEEKDKLNEDPEQEDPEHIFEWIDMKAKEVRKRTDEMVKNGKKEEEKRKECWHYTNKICIFGNKCRNKHKEHCREWRENGYCNNKNCELGHARICRDIYETGRCNRERCRYFHPINLRNHNRQNTGRSDYKREYERPSIRRQTNAYLTGETNNVRPRNEYNNRDWEATKDHNVNNFFGKQDRYWIERLEPMVEGILTKMTERMWYR